MLRDGLVMTGYQSFREPVGPNIIELNDGTCEAYNYD